MSFKYLVTAERRRTILLLLLFISLLVLLLFSYTWGHYPIDVCTSFKAIVNRLYPVFEEDWTKQVEIALFHIRIPRLLLGVLVGAGLSMAGATFQAIFHNPMASPNVLGASSGASFGAALAILLGTSSFTITLSAFSFGLLSILLVLMVSRRMRMDRIVSLVLCGVVISSLFSASLSALKLLADPRNNLPAITYWLMGSLNSARVDSLTFAAPPILLSMLIIYLLRWKLNLLTQGDAEAKSMGVEVKKVRLILIVAATLITSTAVAVSGVISWIGLVIPYISTLIFGADYRYKLPGVALLGALFTVVVDNAARLLTTSEIPLSILTSFIGAPIFLVLMYRQGRVKSEGWE